jgi:hypothetical protein
MINFHFDVEKSSIFYEFELRKVLKHPVVFYVLYIISRNLRAKAILAFAPPRRLFTDS